jgi:hypothetical protein
MDTSHVGSMSWQYNTRPEASRVRDWGHLQKARGEEAIGGIHLNYMLV